MLGLWLLVGLVAALLVLRLSLRIITALLVLLWVAITLLHGLMPGSAAARLVGGDLHVWLLAGGVVVLFLGYRAALRWLRARANAAQGSDAPPETAPDQVMSDAELDRYARHLVLREIGGPGQMRLRAARVLIVGAGGLGAPVCLYLAAAGVGHVTLADDDTVSLSNLQRQVIFRSDQRGQMKARAAAATMAALNPHITVTVLERRIATSDAALVAGHDLVLDGTDSFASRDTVNRLCAQVGVPLIAGSIAQWEGQLTLYDPARGGPCMACLFPEAPAPGLAPPCSEAGVIGPLPGVIGSMMALEAIKHLAGVNAAQAGQGLLGRMLIFDGLYGESRMIGISARADCPVCQARKDMVDNS